MTARSEEAVAGALSAVLRDHGWSVAANGKRLRAALNDVLGADADEHRGALDAVALAAEEGIVAELREAGRERAGAVLPGLVDRLAGWGLSVDLATWAVGAWAAELPEATLPPPVTAEPPATRSGPQRVPVLAPTALPGAATPDVGVTLPPPQHSPRPARPVVDRGVSRRGGAPGRGVVVGSVVAAVVLIAGGVAAALSMSSYPQPPESGEDSTISTSPSPGASEGASPPPASPGAVVAADSARVPFLDGDVAMGSRTGGVRLARLGEVESVGSGADERSAPDGGRLIAFRVADWPCESGSCRPWTRLGLVVSVGGEKQPVPRRAGSDTFAVAVPGGVEDVDLVMEADGLTQSLSLLTGKPGEENVAVLARRGRVDRIDARFTLTERTSTAFDYGDVVTDTVPRQVTVSRAELVYFTDHGRPSSPGKAFLKVRAQYTIPYGSTAGVPAAFELQEISFVGRDGTTYRPRDIDEGPGIDAVFEVPAGLQGGTLRLGGRHRVTTGAVPHTRTVTERSIPIAFG